MPKIITHVVGMVGTNCYIVYNDNHSECVVIDPGDDAPGILRILGENGLTPRYIFLTHGHFDHILAANGLRDATGAEIVIHEADAERLTDPQKSLAPRALSQGLGAPADQLASEGAAFAAAGLAFRWLHTPGHTPGSCCILCGDTLFTGDTLFADDCGRCDLPGGDYRIMLQSLRRLAELPGDYAVYPGHMESTTMERERKMNVNMREALT